MKCVHDAIACIVKLNENYFYDAYQQLQWMGYEDKWIDWKRYVHLLFLVIIDFCLCGFIKRKSLVENQGLLILFTPSLLIVKKEHSLLMIRRLAELRKLYLKDYFYLEKTENPRFLL